MDGLKSLKTTYFEVCPPHVMANAPARPPPASFRPPASDRITRRAGLKRQPRRALVIPLTSLLLATRRLCFLSLLGWIVLSNTFRAAIEK